MSRPVRHLNWVLTINNPGGEGATVHQHHTSAASILQQDSIRYSVFQIEVGENGTVHAQAYLQLHSSASLATVKRKISIRAHWEVRQGSHVQAATYCQKEATRAPGCEPEEWGEPKDGQGTRSDLIAIREFIDSGATELDVWEQHFAQSVRYHRAFAVYRSIRTPQRSFQTHVTVIYGPSGSGKSFEAQRLAGPEAYWLPRPNSGRAFWDGYTGQECTVIDEFNGWLQYTFLLRLLDRYPLRVENKGGSLAFVSRKIFITTNDCPVTWYRKGLQSLRRRLSGTDRDGNSLGQVFYKASIEEELEAYVLPEDPEPGAYAEAGRNDPFAT